jgi:hypothetical protein
MRYGGLNLALCTTSASICSEQWLTFTSSFLWTYVCMYVCMHARMYVRTMCVCVCLYAYTYMYVYVCIYARVCVCVCMHVCVCVCAGIYVPNLKNFEVIFLRPFFGFHVKFGLRWTDMKRCSLKNKSGGTVWNVVPDWKTLSLLPNDSWTLLTNNKSQRN